MIKCGLIYQLGDCLVLCTLSTDKQTGIWKSIQPFYKLPSKFDDNLVHAIHNILNQSKQRIFFANDYSFAKSIKDSIGLSMKKLYQKEVKNVLIEENDYKISFIPSMNNGNNKGFYHLNEKVVSMIYPYSNQNIFSALHEAFSRCE